MGTGPAIVGGVIVFSSLGYYNVELNSDSTETGHVTLKEDIEQIDPSVVTALGIKRSQKSLSYNAQQVGGESLTAVKDANFINSLSGKVAGLNINASSSGIGGVSKVVMRGAKSIEQSSNALYVIDGIPMGNFRHNAGEEFQSQGSSESIADINPEDIESMTVLSGAAAAALYGSEAANGAILITTKKGSSQSLSIDFSSNTEVVTPFVLPRFQNSYGTGDRSSYQSSATYSWGPEMGSKYNVSKDYFRTGVNQSNNISMSVGNERNQFYASAGMVTSKGIIPNNSYSRYNFTFRNSTGFWKGKGKIDVGASYIAQNDRNMTNQGVYSNPLVPAYLFPRSNDWESVKMYERYDSSRGIFTQYWPAMGQDGFQMQNPYWINYRNIRENDKRRYSINASLSLDFTEWLNVSARAKIDDTVNDYTERYWATTNLLLTENSRNGLYGITKENNRQLYGDILANFNKSFLDGNLYVQATLGASVSDLYYDASQVRGPIAYGLLIGYDKDGNPLNEPDNIPNVFNVFNLSNSATARTQTGWHDQTQSIFFSAEAGWRSTYYLTVTGRNDWPSQLAGPNSVKKSFFYPSVGASAILSELFPEKLKNLEYLKVRFSWASVGNAFPRFYANPSRSWNNSTSTWNLSTQNPLYSLKPEITNSFEVGIDARFLRHCSIVLSLYDARTTNQTFNTGIPASSKYSSIYVQSGSVRNRGVELQAGYRNSWRSFGLESSLTFSANQNTILQLGRDVINPNTGKLWEIDDLDIGGLGNVRFILREGGSLGDIYSRADLTRDTDGDIYVNEEGKIYVQNKTKTSDYIRLGSVFPKANIAWRNDFSLKGFTLGFVISARIGGVVYSRTQATMDYYGVSAASAEARAAGGFCYDGKNFIDAQNWYQTIGNGDTVPQFYTYSATNVRLQELSLGYSVPKEKLGGVCSINISVAARNLLMIYNKAPFDPELVASTGNYYQGIDYFMMPSLRSASLNLRIKF